MPKKAKELTGKRIFQIPALTDPQPDNVQLRTDGSIKVKFTGDGINQIPNGLGHVRQCKHGIDKPLALTVLTGDVLRVIRHGATTLITTSDIAHCAASRNPI